MIFKFSTNFLLPYARKPAKYGGCGSTGLDATPTVQIHICHPVDVVADGILGKNNERSPLNKRSPL